MSDGLDQSIVLSQGSCTCSGDSCAHSTSGGSCCCASTRYSPEVGDGSEGRDGSCVGEEGRSIATSVGDDLFGVGSEGDVGGRVDFEDALFFL